MSDKLTVTTGDPYWDAMYAVAQAKAESCSQCADAPEAVSFLQDAIHVKTGKPLYDESNFNKWMRMLTKRRRRRSRRHDEGILSYNIGLMHGLEEADKRSRYNDSFYDSDYDTTNLLNSKVQSSSLTEALRRHRVLR